MIKIALVGDIGSGKSYIAKQFNYPVFNADNEVSKLYQNNKLCFKKLKKIIPKYLISFPIKKSEISEAILSNKNNIYKIVRIIHPEIKKKMNNFLKKNKNKKFIILDIPLLLENKINKKGDIIIFVDSKKKEILKRLKKRPGFNLKLLTKFRKIQMSNKIKKKKSNFVIKNNFKSANVKKNVRIILKKLLNKNG